ncbi:hypothetical protein Ahia01_001126300, partial [Argonauta hians]
SSLENVVIIQQSQEINSQSLIHILSSTHISYPHSNVHLTHIEAYKVLQSINITKILKQYRVQNASFRTSSSSIFEKEMQIKTSDTNKQNKTLNPAAVNIVRLWLGRLTLERPSSSKTLPKLTADQDLASRIQMNCVIHAGVENGR